MGIVNVTPDSFSDGGLFLAPERAIEHARRLAAAGAEILDVGGESTRPGARAVGAEGELARVAPVLAGLRGVEATGSIDTSKTAVAGGALAARGGAVQHGPGFRPRASPSRPCAGRRGGR